MKLEVIIFVNYELWFVLIHTLRTQCDRYNINVREWVVRNIVSYVVLKVYSSFLFCVTKHKHLSIVVHCTDCTLHTHFTKCISSCLTVNDMSGSSVPKSFWNFCVWFIINDCFIFNVMHCVHIYITLIDLKK